MGIQNSIFFIYLMPFFLFLTPHKSLADPSSEALLTFKSEIIDDSNSLINWVLPPGSDPSVKIVSCSWLGVQCDESSTKIITLDLSMKNLGGSLSGEGLNLLTGLVNLNLSHNLFSNQFPSSVFTLSSLRSLDISRNNFSGEFPNGISNLTNLVSLDAFSNGFSGHLPEGISGISSLKTLNFAGSYFTGPIPSQYGLLKNLEFIHLGGNFLSGKIPSELGTLTKLLHMEIGYNSFEGEIPWEFGNLTSLVYLDIAGSNVSGSIPAELCNLTNLESLFLFRNMISGEIPRDLSKMLALKSLDLSDNLISGSIPEHLSELKNLSLLSLMYNDLSGSVPQGISQMPNLESLLIWNNYLTGKLPDDLGRFSKLKHVDVSTNFLSGTIPESICYGGKLQKLIMFSNNFSGELSPSLSNCSSLVRIRLEENSFSGQISLDFWNLSYVDLSKNKFIGGVSSEIDHAYKLEYFNVSYNEELGGLLPDRLWFLPNLQNFSMVSCGLSGNVPPFEGCESVSVIELRMNRLSGLIPISISNCKHLLRMDLSENNLSGSIPVGFTDLPLVSILDLSHNNLHGLIPVQFSNISSLKLLNVSYNDISGSIPSVFRKMDQTAFLGNPLLCGVPLRRCHGFELEVRKTQKSAWVLILISALVLFSAVLVILYYKKGLKNKWEMISFEGLPHFTPKDVLTSLVEKNSVDKVVLPTGIAVSARRIEWEPNEMGRKLRVLIRIGSTRHKNLTRMLGICYNNHFGYLLYECLPYGKLSEKIGLKLDWETKCRILCGIAEGLSFLHHECYPSIPHGNLDANNVVLDEKMEPRLVEYGVDYVTENTDMETDGSIASLMDKLYADVYSFGELILVIITNGRRVSSTNKEALISEVAEENHVLCGTKVKLAIEVAFLCIRSRPSDRPSTQDVVKLLSGLKSIVKT